MTAAATPAWRAWAIWSMGAAFFFYAFLQRVAPSVMVPDLMRDFDVGASALGGLSAFYFYAYMAVQLPTGLLTDRFGPRRILTAAALISALGGIVFATADSLLTAGLGRLCVGAGAGFGFVCTLRIATDWFPAERMALLSGMTMMSGMAGGVIGQAPLSLAVAEFGWRPAMIGVALYAVVVALGALALTGGARPIRTGGAPVAPVLASLKGALGHPQTWIIAGYGFSIVTIMFAFGGLWGVPYLVQVRGLTRPDAAFAVSLILLGWGLFAPLVGWLSDRWRRRKPSMIASALLSLATIVPVVYLPDLSGFAIKLLLFLNGVAVAGMVVSFATTREHNDPTHAGTAMAFVNMAVIGAGAIMQPVTGWLLDLGWQGELVEGVRVYSADAYRQAFIVLPASCVAAFVLALMVGETSARAKPPHPSS
ncbi:MAG: MFS transporter [Rhodospirillaceae bacterium]